jgi:hypothetical protein
MAKNIKAQNMGHRFECPRAKKNYFCSMFVCKKKNPSGVVSVQVINKSKGKYRVIQNSGY